MFLDNPLSPNIFAKLNEIENNIYNVLDSPRDFWTPNDANLTDEILSETSQLFYENPLPVLCEDRRSQAGRGAINNGASTSGYSDYWTPLESRLPYDLDSAVLLMGRSRRHNRRFQCEEISYQVMIDPDRLPSHAQYAHLSKVLSVVRSLFQTMLERATRNLAPTDLI